MKLSILFGNHFFDEIDKECEPQGPLLDTTDSLLGQCAFGESYDVVVQRLCKLPSGFDQDKRDNSSATCFRYRNGVVLGIVYGKNIPYMTYDLIGKDLLCEKIDTVFITSCLSDEDDRDKGLFFLLRQAWYSLRAKKQIRLIAECNAVYETKKQANTAFLSEYGRLSKHPKYDTRLSLCIQNATFTDEACLHLYRLVEDGAVWRLSFRGCDFRDRLTYVNDLRQLCEKKHVVIELSYYLLSMIDRSVLCETALRPSYVTLGVFCVQSITRFEHPIQVLTVTYAAVTSTSTLNVEIAGADTLPSTDQPSHLLVVPRSCDQLNIFTNATSNTILEFLMRYTSPLFDPSPSITIDSFESQIHSSSALPYVNGFHCIEGPSSTLAFVRDEDDRYESSSSLTFVRDEDDKEAIVRKSIAACELLRLAFAPYTFPELSVKLLHARDADTVAYLSVIIKNCRCPLRLSKFLPHAMQMANVRNEVKRVVIYNMRIGVVHTSVCVRQMMRMWWQSMKKKNTPIMPDHQFMRDPRHLVDAICLLAGISIYKTRGDMIVKSHGVLRRAQLRNEFSIDENAHFDNDDIGICSSGVIQTFHSRNPDALCNMIRHASGVSRSGFITDGGNVARSYLRRYYDTVTTSFFACYACVYTRTTPGCDVICKCSKDHETVATAQF